MGTSVQLDDSTLESFNERVRGAVVEPSSEDYDEERTVWNGIIDKEPAVIIQCSGAADVMAAVDFALEQGLDLAVNGGGHHIAGHAVCEGLVVDLSPMNGIRVDPDAKSVRVQGGATWGDLNHELRRFGLDIVGMSYPEVGVGGFTLGGGMGLLSREHGLAIDNLRSVDLVTADAELLHASEDDHPELFWALRGGSGNYGVVSSFEFDCNEVGPEAVFGIFLHPPEAAREAIEFYREFTADAPDELMCVSGIGRVPEDSDLPEAYHGEPATFLVGVYTGPVEEGKRLLEPIGEFGDPMLEVVDTGPYHEVGLGRLDAGRRNYWKNHLFADLSEDAIETLVDTVRPLPDATTQVGFDALGGAINRVPETATAYPHRDAAHLFEIVVQWMDPGMDETCRSWASEVHEAMAPYATGGEYVNNQSEDDIERISAAYGDNYDQLGEVKTEWDPKNLFSSTQNIEPNH